jgi:hypothetical protein
MASKNSTRKILNKMSKLKRNAESLECFSNRKLVANRIDF